MGSLFADPVVGERAGRLPAPLRFGTSSWIYPGWKHSIYTRDYRSEAEFRRNCLSEYAEYPWFRTVGIDGSYYNPAKAEQLERFASQLPHGFQWISKVWQELTIARFPQHERYRDRAGRDNERFLDPHLFHDAVLPAFAAPGVAERNGPLVLQMQPGLLQAVTPEAFLGMLDRFLAEMPDELRFAVEIRDDALLTKEYFDVLNEHGATHVFNHWSWMPPLLTQMKAAASAGGLAADFYVARLLTPRGLAYAKAVERFQPYTELKEPQTEMREDVVRLARRALQRNADTFILVNNRCEGNAPTTIAEIGQRILDELDDESPEKPNPDGDRP